MAWVKLDDQFANHPKVTAAGGDAAWLYVAGLCYCQSQLTDGVIPEGIVARLTDRKNAAGKLAAKLVEVGLWEYIGDAYVVHDYGKHNEPAAKIKAKREATKERVNKWREKRDGNAVGNAVTDASQEQHGNALQTIPYTPPLTANRNPLTATANTKKQRGPAAPSVCPFDLEALYLAGPSRDGKAAGMKHAARLLTTQTEYDLCLKGIALYAAAKAKDPIGLAYFSTWMNAWPNSEWRDYALGKGAPAAPTLFSPRPARNFGNTAGAVSYAADDIGGEE